MSAGRIRYLVPGAKGPKTPMFRSASQAADELVLTEAGKKKRAGVWLRRRRQVEADLAHLGPDALELDAAALGEILARERRQLHPLLRDQRVIAGIGRAHANEILLRARLSPFKPSTDLSPAEVETLAAAMHEDLERGARAARARARTTSDVYRVHNRLGEPCPRLRHPDRARRLRGAHDLLLPALPDRRADPQGPPALAAPALTSAGTVTA